MAKLIRLVGCNRCHLEGRESIAVEVLTIGRNGSKPQPEGVCAEHLAKDFPGLSGEPAKMKAAKAKITTPGRARRRGRKPRAAAKKFPCPYCDRKDLHSGQGLSAHKRSAHPEEYKREMKERAKAA